MRNSKPYDRQFSVTARCVSVVLAVVFHVSTVAGENGWTLVDEPDGPPFAIAFSSVPPYLGYMATRSGLYRSTDAGQNWNLIYTLVQPMVGMPLLTHPTDPDGVYFVGFREVYESTNAGQDFSSITSGLDAFFCCGAHRLRLITMGADGIVYLTPSVDAGNVWYQQSPSVWSQLTGLPAGVLVDIAASPSDPDHLIVAKEGSGILVTHDAGNTWTVGTGVPPTIDELSKIRIAPNGSDVIFLSATAEDSDYRSTDGGLNWSPMTTNFEGALTDLVYDPDNSNRAYAVEGRNAIVDSLPVFQLYQYESEDGGVSWVSTPMTDSGLNAYSPPRGLAVVPNTSEVLLGESDGLWRKPGFGQSFSYSQEGFSSQSRPSFAGVASDDSNVIMVGKGPFTYRSNDGGGAWTMVFATSGPNGEFGAYDPSADVLYSGYSGELLRSVDRGDTFDSVLRSSEVFSELTSVLGVKPSPDGSGSYFAWRGGLFTQIADLRSSVNGGNLVSIDASLFGPNVVIIEPSPFDGNIVLGVGDISVPNLNQSFTGGVSWVQRNSFLAGHGYITFNPHDIGEVYAGKTHGIPPYQRVVSQNNGTTWQQDSTDFGLIDQRILDLYFHPSAPSARFARTENELIRSVDSGATWETMSQITDPDISGSSAWLDNELVIDQQAGYRYYGLFNEGLAVYEITRDVSLSFEAVSENAIVGQPANYRVVLENLSDGGALGPVVTLELPDNAQFQSATGAACSTDSASLNCRFDSLLANDTNEAIITLTPTSVGVLIVTASVSLVDLDTDTGNNTESDSTLIAMEADSDLDSVPDSIDNCTLVANSDQRDSNDDGFGNICDPDFNNDGIVNFLDVSVFANGFLGSDPDLDLNGDSAVNFVDLIVVTSYFFLPPGPSAQQ